jgi:hypothetical protein
MKSDRRARFRELSDVLLGGQDEQRVERRLIAGGCHCTHDIVRIGPGLDGTGSSWKVPNVLRVEGSDVGPKLSCDPLTMVIYLHPGNVAGRLFVRHQRHERTRDPVLTAACSALLRMF